MKNDDGETILTASAGPLECDLDLLALQMLGTMLLASLATFIGADWRS